MVKCGIKGESWQDLSKAAVKWLEFECIIIIAGMQSASG